MKNDPMVRLDRAAGVLVGAAAGDALGAGYEFGAPVKPEDVDMIGGGLGNFEPGEWTDDTSMAAAIAEVSAVRQDLESTGALDMIVENFLGWYRSGPADVGIQTSRVLGSLTGGTAQEALAYSQELHAQTGRTAGNGSLMRTGVVALTALGDDETIALRARRVSDLTHADPLAGDACVIWCIAIDRALRESRLDGVFDGVELLPPQRREFWTQKILDVKNAEADFSSNGFVVTAFQAALAAVWATPADGPAHLERTLRQAVSIGDDTDTVAAIAGMLAGARWGASAVPARMKTMLHGWPGMTVSGLARLALKSTGEHLPWLDAESMADHYAQVWPSDPYHASVEGVPGFSFGNFAALNGAAAQAADVRVSLCRIGERERSGESLEVWVADTGDSKVNPNLEFMIADTADYVKRSLASGKKVFMHCALGSSRTPIFAAKVVSEVKGVSVEEALKIVLSEVPTQDIKPGMIEALRRS